MDLYSPASEESSYAQMTMHLLLMTPDEKSFIWVTDELARFGKTDYGTVDKVTYLRDLKIACSIWGDMTAMRARDEIIRRAKDNSLPLSDPGEMVVSLKDVGAQTLLTEFRTPSAPQPVPRGVILATLGDTPHIYTLALNGIPMAVRITGQVNCGDDDNPALLFPAYYYERSEKSVEELISIGVHAMKLAAIMNGKGLRGIRVWTYHEGNFKGLDREGIRPYVLLSDSIDLGILEKFKSGPQPNS